MNSPREAAPPGTAAHAQARQASKGMFGKRTTAPAPFWSRNRKIVALSAIFGIIIGLGVTAAAGGTLYFTFQSQTDPFTASSAVELRNLNVVRDDDTLTVTGVLKNSGQTSISRLWIDNLAVSNLVAFQSLDNGNDPTATDDNLMLFVRHLDTNPTHYMCIIVGGASCPNQLGGDSSAITQGSSFATNITTRQFDGISMRNAASGGQDVESVLEGGRTQAFKVVITCSGPGQPGPCNIIDISRDVAISDRLTLTFGYASGDDILVSDAYSARVRSG